MRTHISQLFPPVSHIKHTQRWIRKHFTYTYTCKGRTRMHWCKIRSLPSCLFFISLSLNEWSIRLSLLQTNFKPWQLKIVEAWFRKQLTVSGDASLGVNCAHSLLTIHKHWIYVKKPTVENKYRVRFFYFMYKRVQQYPRSIYTFEEKVVLSCSINTS